MVLGVYYQTTPYMYGIYIVRHPTPMVLYNKFFEQKWSYIINTYQIYFIVYYIGEDQMTPTNLTKNVIPFKNVIIDINFIKFIVGLQVYII
jgi:hypothetical protein